MYARQSNEFARWTLLIARRLLAIDFRLLFVDIICSRFFVIVMPIFGRLICRSVCVNILSIFCLWISCLTLLRRRILIAVFIFLRIFIGLVVRIRCGGGSGFHCFTLFHGAIECGVGRVREKGYIFRVYVIVFVWERTLIIALCVCFSNLNFSQRFVLLHVHIYSGRGSFVAHSTQRQYANLCC